MTLQFVGKSLLLPEPQFPNHTWVVEDSVRVHLAQCLRHMQVLRKQQLLAHAARAFANSKQDLNPCQSVAKVHISCEKTLH